jgi:hypothetical protein
MKEYLQNADYSKKTMEFGDHYKNGASPKSLTSRGNILFGMKKFFLLLTAILVCGTINGFGQFGLQSDGIIFTFP